MDDIDRTSERMDFELPLQIQRQLEKNHRMEAVSPPQCEDCEENPRAVLHGGAKSRYCERCLTERMEMQHRTLVYI